MRRDDAILALLFGCGLRRSESVRLDVEKVQVRQEHWVIVDLVGKGGHFRTVPVPQWVKEALDRLKTGTVREGGVSHKVVWDVVDRYSAKIGLDHVAPYDLRRTCAKLCHSSRDELEQIQFLLGHASVQTTERYLGCKQNLGDPVNDPFTIVPQPVSPFDGDKG